MIPKKHKDVLKEIIDKNGFDKNFTEDAVSFYWSEIRKTLTELSTINISIRRFGIFTLKHWKVDEFINNYKTHLDKEAMTFEEAKYRKKMETQYNRFLKLKELVVEEELRKIKKKETRITYEHSKNMGEQIQDNGGSSQHSNQEEGC